MMKAQTAKHPFHSVAFWFFGIALIVSAWAGLQAPVYYVVETRELSPEENEEAMDSAISEADSALWGKVGQTLTTAPKVESEIVQTPARAQGEGRFFELSVNAHRGAWSLLPALITIVLCFLTREPLAALAGGVVSGALVIQAYDLTGDVLLPAIASNGAALVIVLYLLFLGGLLGIWSRNGGSLAFAQWITQRFVRGPKTAKMAAWLLGVFFFQGGTISTLLVGTTIKPVADEEKISHEELAYIVDSTASPIAILLPFNAWPIYVQGLIFVGGVGALATEADRISFFFGAIPLYFYAILAVCFTLLMSLDRLPLISTTFRQAITRSRERGLLDRPGAKPLQSVETSEVEVASGYRPVAWEFALPIGLIITIAVGTFIFMGSPNVLWAFGIALGVAFFCSRFRGLSLSQLTDGFGSGLKSVVYGAVILLLAVVIGRLNQETGGGLFLVDFLGGAIPYWILPAVLFFITFLIAFATGTSWGTFAIALPLAMPLAWATGTGAGLSSELLFLQIGFAAVINGSVFGDQCSPISDTTVLSSLATGCDLMDHVRTQIYPCLWAGGFAVAGWTLLCVFLS